MNGLSRFATAAASVALGLAWPLLELVGSAPPFFIARGAAPGEIALFAVIVAIGLPVVAGSLGLLPGPPGRLLWVAVTGVGLLGLGASISRAIDGGTATWLLVNGLVVVGGLAAFERSEGARLAARMLLGAPVVILAVFLLATPVGAYLREGEPAPVTRRQAEEHAEGPFVVVIFDEFATASIVDTEGRLRTERYPGLARLAELGSWFPNATSVGEFTEVAVPAVLSGTQPDPDLDPVLSDHPINLFTATPSNTAIVAHETVTRLCPDTECVSPVVQPTARSRWALMAADVGVALAHLSLPPIATQELPDLRTNWMNFGLLAVNGAAEAPDRVVRDFLDNGVRSAGKDTLLVLHVLLPHRPWVFLGDGTRYGEDLSSSARAVDLVPEQRDLALQRYLLQTQYADRFVAELLALLENRELLDEATVIVTADHGVSFDATDGARTPREDTVHEVGMVPLFVKSPRIAPGTVDPYFANGLDVTPTVLDAMMVDRPLVGASLLQDDRPARTEAEMLGRNGPFTWTPSLSATRIHAARVDSLFPSGSLYALMAQDAPPLPQPAADRVLAGWFAPRSWTLRPADVYGDPSPAMLVARGPAEDAGRWIYVLSGGEPVAAGRTFARDGSAIFEAVIDPDVLARGDLELLIHTGD